jgi:hypothetical protein
MKDMDEIEYTPLDDMFFVLFEIGRICYLSGLMIVFLFQTYN